MRYLLLAIVTAGVMLGIGWQANAKVTVVEKNRYFNVAGKTGKQIYQQIRRRAPPDLRRKRWIAATYAKYDFKKVKFAIRNNRCVATNVNIQLNITYHYPKWKKRRGSSGNVQKNWQAFERGLALHERTHGKIYLEMVKQIERELKTSSGSAGGTCRRHIKNMERKIEQIEKRYDRKQVAFDRAENRRNSRISKTESKFVNSE